MREDQSFPAHLKPKKCDTFESLWGDFSANWSKIGPQTAGVWIVLQSAPFLPKINLELIKIRSDDDDESRATFFKNLLALGVHFGSALVVIDFNRSFIFRLLKFVTRVVPDEEFEVLEDKFLDLFLFALVELRQCAACELGEEFDLLKVIVIDSILSVDNLVAEREIEALKRAENDSFQILGDFPDLKLNWRPDGERI